MNKRRSLRRRHFKPRGFYATMALIPVLTIGFALSLTAIFGVWQYVALKIPYIGALGVTELVLATLEEYSIFLVGTLAGIVGTVCLVGFGYIEKDYRLGCDVRT